MLELSCSPVYTAMAYGVYSLPLCILALEFVLSLHLLTWQGLVGITKQGQGDEKNWRSAHSLRRFPSAAPRVFHFHVFYLQGLLQIDDKGFFQYWCSVCSSQIFTMIQICGLLAVAVPSPPCSLLNWMDGWRKFWKPTGYLCSENLQKVQALCCEQL